MLLVEPPRLFICFGLVVHGFCKDSMYLHGCADMSLLFVADELLDELMGCNCWLVASVSAWMS
jgi:hypothetical protein